MEIFRTVSMFILGIGMFIVGFGEIRNNAKSPLVAILCCLAMSIGLVGYLI